MRRSWRLLTATLCIGLLGEQAGAASAITGGVQLSGDHRELTLVNIDPPLGLLQNVDCSGPACEKLYAFEYQGLDEPPTGLPTVTSAKTEAGDFTRVVFTLSGPYTPRADVVFGTKLDVRVAGGKTRSVKGEFPIESSLGFIAGIPSLRGRLFYRSLEPIPVASLTALRSRITVALKDTDTGQAYSRHVSMVEVPPGDKSGSDVTHIGVLNLDRPLPNRNVSITVSGIEAGASPSISVKAAPVTKDSARFYVSGQYVANHDGDDTLAVEYKLKLITRAIGRSQFDFGLLTEGNVGSDALKKPDSLRTALEFRYWIPSTQPGWSETSIPLFLEYVTDKKRDNQQLGGSLWFEPTIPAFTRNTITMKKLWTRPEEAATQRFGWSFTPRVGVEAGTSLRSSSDQLEGDSYFRAVAATGLLLQVRNVSLDTTYQVRHLFSDELTVSETGLTRIDRGARQYLRSELGYQAGAFKFSVKLEVGELAPAFKKTNGTTIGIAMLF